MLHHHQLFSRSNVSFSGFLSLARHQVDVPDFLSILDLVKPQDGEVFVDLGSGTGKAVLTAACGFPEFVKVRCCCRCSCCWWCGWRLRLLRLCGLGLKMTMPDPIKMLVQHGAHTIRYLIVSKRQR